MVDLQPADFLQDLTTGQPVVGIPFGKNSFPCQIVPPAFDRISGNSTIGFSDLINNGHDEGQMLPPNDPLLACRELWNSIFIHKPMLIDRCREFPVYDEVNPGSSLPGFDFFIKLWP